MRFYLKKLWKLISKRENAQIGGILTFFQSSSNGLQLEQCGGRFEVVVALADAQGLRCGKSPVLITVFNDSR
jgi:hypothetical protein